MAKWTEWQSVRNKGELLQSGMSTSSTSTRSFAIDSKYNFVVIKLYNQDAEDNVLHIIPKGMQKICGYPVTSIQSMVSICTTDVSFSESGVLSVGLGRESWADGSDMCHTLCIFHYDIYGFVKNPLE